MQNLQELIGEAALNADEAKKSIGELEAEKAKLEAALETHLHNAAYTEGHVARLEKDLVEVHVETLIHGQTILRQSGIESLSAEINAHALLSKISSRIEAEVKRQLAKVGKRLEAAHDAIRRHEELWQYQQLKLKLQRIYTEQDLAELRKLSFMDGTSSPLRHDFDGFIDELQKIHITEAPEF